MNLNTAVLSPLFFLYIFLSPTLISTTDSLKIIFAVNAGGDASTDSNGINYQKDFLKIGIASDYGKHLMAIGRTNDPVLYQTERYHHSTFGYEIPINEDGHYVMVLKFCEVYFNAANMKVFDVVLNGDHTVISDLDIYDKVGHGQAYDEIVPFEVANKGQLLIYNGQESDIRGGKIRIEFIKGYRDNPKVNAIYVMKGTIDEVPQLAPIHHPPPEEEFEEKQEPFEAERPLKPRKVKSGPRSPDPYEDISLSSSIFPVFVAIGAFIPVLFCLCRL